jgi:SNF family Na+-dependent transporter
LKLQQAKFIQEENTIVIIGKALLCIGILYWTYKQDKRHSEELNDNESVETHLKERWRIRRSYFLPGVVLLMMIWELLKRI